MLLSILIAVSSRTDLLADCLASLQRHIPDDLSYETIVVLNELDPAHASVLQGRYPTVRFLRSPVNLGMAGSANRARREASGRFLVTLHDDATVEPGWAEALLAAAEQHPRAGAIGSKILFPDGRLQSAGAILWRSGVTTPPWTGAAPDARDGAHARAVDYCGTCSLLIRAEAFDAVGGFDEAIYPGYFVDVDLGLALRAQEYYVLCEPRSVVRHRRHASSGKVLRTVAIARNRSYLLRKWATAIAGHEPEPKPCDMGDIQSALLRAARYAQACEAGTAMPIACESLPDTTTPAGDDLERHYRLSRDLHDAIVAHLEASLAARHAARPRSNRLRTARFCAALRSGRRALARVIGRCLRFGR